ncbi:hypothetical protein R1sor_013246 [Riccia sorocarpa]|uniref:Uncharacterized protein n=1 Tax=Riccia sorocarpa TaxID=122646 RepID=A0ABD3H8W5_9MARC
MSGPDDKNLTTLGEDGTQRLLTQLEGNNTLIKKLLSKPTNSQLADVPTGSSDKMGSLGQDNVIMTSIHKSRSAARFDLPYSDTLEEEEQRSGSAESHVRQLIRNTREEAEVEMDNLEHTSDVSQSPGLDLNMVQPDVDVSETDPATTTDHQGNAEKSSSLST